MSSVECLREFVTERLTAAAEEIFRVVEKTIVEYEEEIARQRRLLDVVWKPEIKLHRIELPQQHVCKKEEVLSDQQLNMPVITSVESEANSDHQLLSHNSHEAESQDQKGGKHGESGSTRNAEPDPKKRRRKSRSHSNNVDNTNVSEIHPNTQTELPQQHVCKKEEVLSDQQLNMPVITSVESEANSDHQLLSHNSHEAESQDQKGGKHGESGSTRNAEPDPKKRRRKSRSHSNNVDNTNVSEIHPNTQTELPQQHVFKEEEVLSDQQLCIQERNSSLDQEDPEPPQIKEEQEELCPSQEGEQLVLKQETDTFMLTPTYEESDHSEGQTLNFNPDDDSLSAAEKESVANMPVITSVVSEANSDHQLLSHNSHEAESQDQKGDKHGDSGSTRNAEPEPKKRRRKSRSHSNNVDNTNVSEIHPNTQTELPQQHVCKEEEVLNSHEAESQDQKGGEHGDSASTRNAEPEPKKRRRKSRSHSNNVDNTNVTEIHPNTQTGKKSFICDTCGRDFKYNSYLQRHLRNHTGEKPYSCKSCGKDFRRKHHLEIHMRIHTGEKPYVCKTCRKRFCDGSGLTKHMRTHRG
ncbi:zinc finger protein 37-like isoform X2 [Sander lucioperca]|uniref:zinc finger protein 37-like isoform X2 n=1 Tax=Sander lucioperca TaxID=283035 RepID=UPI0016538102|nr:zinc finger protein 37-like isoform X2 [Sander lucioperca]